VLESGKNQGNRQAIRCLRPLPLSLLPERFSRGLRWGFAPSVRRTLHAASLQTAVCFRAVRDLSDYGSLRLRWLPCGSALLLERFEFTT